MAGHSQGDFTSRLRNEAVHNRPGVGSSSTGDRIHAWPHLAGQVPAVHVSLSFWGIPALLGTWECIYSPPPVADPVPGTVAPSSKDKGGLGNRILEAALPPGPADTTRHTLTRDPSLFQVTKIHQSPTVATMDVDSSARDTGETKGQQEPEAMEEPKAHSGNEELQMN